MLFVSNVPEAAIENCGVFFKVYEAIPSVPPNREELLPDDAKLEFLPELIVYVTGGDRGEGQQ